MTPPSPTLRDVAVALAGCGPTHNRLRKQRAEIARLRNLLRRRTRNPATPQPPRWTMLPTKTEPLTDEQKAEIVRAYAAQANGTERYYRSTPFSKLLHTDGVRLLAETCGAYWLIDLIASWQPSVVRKSIRLRDRGLAGFQVWQLTHEPKGAETGVLRNRWVARCWSDLPRESLKLAAQVIPYSDFPTTLDGFKLYVEGGVLFLPEER